MTMAQLVALVDITTRESTAGARPSADAGSVAHLLTLANMPLG